jgi:hypothetical protein
MAYEIPPAPRDYVPPPKRPLRTDADRRRIGLGVIAFGVVFFVGSFVYVRHGSTLSSAQAFVATFPLALLFFAFGGAIWKQGAEGIGPMVAYLSAAVGLCGLVAYWFWGK